MAGDTGPRPKLSAACNIKPEGFTYVDNYYEEDPVIEKTEYDSFAYIVSVLPVRLTGPGFVDDRTIMDLFQQYPFTRFFSNEKRLSFKCTPSKLETAIPVILCNPRYIGRWLPSLVTQNDLCKGAAPQRRSRR